MDNVKDKLVNAEQLKYAYNDLDKRKADASDVSELKGDITHLDVYDLKMVKDYIGYEKVNVNDIVYDYSGGTWKFKDVVIDTDSTEKVRVDVGSVDITSVGQFVFYTSDFSAPYQPIGMSTVAITEAGSYEIVLTNGLGIRLQASKDTSVIAKECRISAISIIYGNTSEKDVQGLPDYFVGTADIKRDFHEIKNKINELTIPPHEQTKWSRSESFFTECVSSAKEQVVSATVTFDTLTKFEIGLTKANDYSASANLVAYVEVDSNNVTLHYSFYGSPRTVVDPHNLSISGMVGVKLYYNWTNTLAVLVTTISGTFEKTYNAPYVRIGKCYPFNSLNAVNGHIIGFSNVFPKINKNVWLFGDSYFSEVPERWVYYVDRTKCFFNGYPGEGSTNALEELEYLLTVGKPKYVVWCLGMNDTNQTTWNNAFTRLKELSSQYGFELVMGITPTVPTRLNNENYRTSILSSGLRYIDFYSAVGTNESGIWFDGLISDDGVHPSILGGKVLASQVYADFPEIAMD